MYDSTHPTKDEKQIKDFMVAKYEKKMYYSDPVNQKLKNGIQSNPTIPAVTTTYQVIIIIWLLKINKEYLIFIYVFVFRNLGILVILHQP